MTREDLCAEIGVDPSRPYVLYTTGIDNHFYDEHLHVELVERLLRELDVSPRPQLVVRTYVKGTSEQMKELSRRNLPDVVFPPVLWDARWQTPQHDDLRVYSNLLRHCAIGINAASTVSLELLHFEKPVINLDFDPPGSNLPSCMGYSRHIDFDHYRTVAQSGAVMVARSSDDMRRYLELALLSPQSGVVDRQRFVGEFFGSNLDGQSGLRVGDLLLDLARGEGD